MSKKKILTPQERKKQEIAQKLEECFNKKGEEKRFVKISAYMLHHKNYIELSNYSKIALMYMRDWATKSTQFWENGKFEYASSMLENIGIMSRVQAVKCFKELREKGFINAEYKNGAGAINRWSFSNRWYTGEREPQPEEDNYNSVKNTSFYKSQEKSKKVKRNVTKTDKKKYVNYLKSSKWKAIRQVVAGRDKFTCQRCGRSVKGYFEIHHKNYRHIFHEEEDLTCLVCLCKGCHEAITRKQKKGRRKRAD